MTSRQASLARIVNISLVLIGLLSVSAISSASAAKLTIVTENAAPLQYIQNGLVTGKTTRLVRTAIEKAKLNAEFRIFPWARSYQMALSTPNTLIYSLVKTPDREHKFEWIGKLLTINLSFVCLEDLAIAPINNIAELKPLSIGVMRNDYTHQLVKDAGFIEDEDFTLFSDIPQLLNLLYAKKIDTFIADFPLIQEMAQELGYDANQLKLAYNIPGQQVPVYLAANKDTDLETINILKRTLSELTGDAS